ncbi:unnamed protein product [Brassicogethes aeneus]|uniref:BTB domain-containing protein n=1 Tax=Brassicogethes aeneus TaxID=1431903 RepID=A0A9P0AVQ3_BRAAE|nr:unnamed protein product [Brassicogethes aeneus]
MKFFIVFCIVAFCNSYAHPTNITSDLKKKHLKIIGGQEAQPHSFPYQVALEIRDKYSYAFCGGSLISANYVLTSASCLQTAITADVILGAHKLSDSENTQLRLSSSDFVFHDDYDPTELSNDIGLVKLPKAVEENDCIKIVKLADEGKDYQGEQGTVTGWGVTEDSSSDICPALQYITNEILSNDQCRSIEPYNDIIRDTHLCLSGVGGKGACNGDTGGAPCGQWRTNMTKLRWHSFKTYLHSCVSSSLHNESYTDVALVTTDGRQIMAHRLVLAYSSQFLKDVLKFQPKVNTYSPLMIVLPPEISFNTLKILVEYMYSGEATVTKDVLDSVLKGGEILKVKGLYRHKENKEGSESGTTSGLSSSPSPVAINKVKRVQHNLKPTITIPRNVQSELTTKVLNVKQPPLKETPNQIGRTMEAEKQNDDEDNKETLQLLEIKNEAIEW